MKNVFGLNKTFYGETGDEKFDGAPFISRSLSAECETEEKPEAELPRLPAFLSAIQYLCVAAFAIGLGIWVWTGKTIAEMLKTAIHVPLLLIGGLLGFAIISVIEIINAKKFAKEHGIENISDLTDYGEIHEYDEQAEAEEAAKVKAELGIPEDARDMDFLSFFYRESEDGPVPFKPFDFMTMEMFVFADEGTLNIADFNDVYSISKVDVKSIEKIEKEVTLLGWSKEESFDSESYAEYGMVENSDGFIVVPYYCSVKIEKDGEEYELLIPPYEIQNITNILGMELN